MDRPGNDGTGSERERHGLAGPRHQRERDSSGFLRIPASSGSLAPDFARQELVVARLLLSVGASEAGGSPQQLPNADEDASAGVSSRETPSNPFVVGASRTGGGSHESHRWCFIREAQQASTTIRTEASTEASTGTVTEARAEALRGVQGEEEPVQAGRSESQGSAENGSGKPRTSSRMEATARFQASGHWEEVPEIPARAPAPELVTTSKIVLPPGATAGDSQASKAAASTNRDAGKFTPGQHSDNKATGEPSQLPAAVETLIPAQGAHREPSSPPLPSLAAVTQPEAPSMPEAGQEEEGEDSPLSSLADDLLQELLRAVSLSSGSLSHALTCRRWSQLAPEAQESVVVREGARLSEDVLLRQLADLPSMTSVHLQRHSLDALSDAFLGRIFSPPEHEAPRDTPSQRSSQSSQPLETAEGGSLRGGAEEANRAADAEVAPRLVSLRIDRLACRDAQMTAQGLAGVLCRTSGLTSLELLGNPCAAREGGNAGLTLPRGISSLVNLRELVLCSRHDHDGPAKCLLVRSIPPTLGALTSLRRLALRSDNLAALPPALTALQSLTDLMLLAPSLAALPGNFSALGKLQRFFLGSKSITALPVDFVLLRDLRRLELACPGLGALPAGMHLLRGLESLRVAACDALRQLPASLSALTGLTDLAASSALAPHDLAGLGPRALRQLRVCPGYLYELPSPAAPVLMHLRTLSVASDTIWRLPSDLGQLAHMRRVVLRCPSLEQLPASFCGLRALAHLTLASCAALRRLPDAFRQLGALRALHVSSSGLTALPPGFPSLPSLRDLSLSWCSALEGLPDDLGALTSLKELTIDTCNVRTLPESISGCASLESLDLTRCLQAPEMEDSLGSLASLKRLRLCQYPLLLHLPEAIGWLSSLEDLQLKGLGAISSLPEALGALDNLRILYIGFCPKLEELPGGLGGLRSLEGLTVEACHELMSLPLPLGALGRLGRLRIVSCARLLVLPRTLGGMGALGHLELRGLDSLRALPESIGALSRLRRLELHHCPQVFELPQGLGSLRGLQRLEINGLGSLRALPASLCELTGLTDIRLSACRSLDGASVRDLLASLPSLSALSRRSLEAAAL